MDVLYPKEVGLPLTTRIFDRELIGLLRKKLDTGLILRFYGFSHTGKQTSASLISKVLGIPWLHESLLVRLITLKQVRDGLEINTELFSKITVSISEEFQVVILYEGKPVVLKDLYLPTVEVKLFSVFQKSEVQDFLSNTVSDFINSSTTPIVISSVGAMPHYLISAIEQGRSVLQFVTDCRDDVALERLIHQQLQILKSFNPIFEPDSNFGGEMKTVLEQYKKLQKPKLYDYIVTNGWGVISPDSYILDTSTIDADQIIGSVLSKLSDIYI
jgi:hypothetical protein